MIRAILAAGLVFAGVVLAQPAAAAPTFEVASIKPAAPPTGNGMRMVFGGGPVSNGRVNYSNVNLKMLLMRAYGVKPYQISGPSWLDTERFDIIAKIPEEASKEQVPLMLQTLLRDRFKVVLHREKKELPMYALLVGKNGPKLKESQADGSDAAAGPAPGAAPPPPPPPPPPGGPAARDWQMPAGRPGTSMMMMPGRARMNAVKQSISGLADMLAGQLDRPLTDLTELKGIYDFTLEWAPEGRIMGPFGGMLPPPGGGGEGGGPPIASTPDGGSGPSIFTAVQEQLGLKLELRKGPVDLLVIDHIDKVPTEN